MNQTLRKVLPTVAALSLFGGVACTDPAVSPTSTVTEENAFKDPSAYLAFLAKLYAGMSTSGQKGPACPGDQPMCKDIQTINDEGFSQYMRLYWEHQELPTDEAVLAWNDGPVQEFNGQTWGSSNSFLSAMFARIYLQVGWANEFLKQTTDAKLSERKVSAALKATVHQYRAEARFLRALAYWHGLDLFGPIPLVTANSPELPKQATKQEIYDFIVSELLAVRDGADEVLPNAGPGTYGRATKEAASMLLAHVYLNAEVYTGTPHYTDALAAASAAIAGPFTLDPVYRHLFMADNNTSREIIFPVTQDGVHSQSYGGTTFLIHASCGGSMNSTDYGLGGGACWWGLRLKPQAYNLLQADPRGSYFYTSGQNVNIAALTNFTDGIAAPKFTNKRSDGAPPSDATFPDTDFPMFRLGDAYLIYAEAVLRGGGGTRAQALDYVNALRVRAYGDSSAVIADAALDLPFILNERGRELLWEAHRRTDLIRFGQFTGGSYIWAWKGGASAAGSATDAHFNLYPLPATQLSANPNLVQNPGY